MNDVARDMVHRIQDIIHCKCTRFLLRGSEMGGMDLTYFLVYVKQPR